MKPQKSKIDDFSLGTKVIEEIGQAISPLIPITAQREEIAINRDQIIKGISEEIEDVSKAFIEAVVDNSRKFSDIYKNIIIPDLYSEKFGGQTALHSWLSNCNSNKEIEKKINFIKHSTIPYPDLFKELREKKIDFLDDFIESFPQMIDRGIKRVTHSLTGIIEELRSTGCINKASTSQDQEIIFQKIIKEKFEGNYILSRYIDDEASFKFIFSELSKSALHGVITLRLFAILNHQIDKSKAEKGVLVDELMERAIKLNKFFDLSPEEINRFKIMMQKAQGYLKYVILGFVEEILNWINFELLRRDKFSLNIDIFPHIFIRECVLHHLTLKKYAEELRQFWHIVRNKFTEEKEFQNFLFNHPRFLLGNQYTYLYEKLQLLDDDGKILIPDFTLVRPDRSIDILELKRANLNRFIVGKPRRERFSQQVMDAIQQAREYKRWFRDKRNKHWFKDTYGTLRLKVLQPQVTLVVGREDELRDAVVFDRLKQEIEDIHIKTYTQLYEEADLIYEQMKAI